MIGFPDKDLLPPDSAEPDFDLNEVRAYIQHRRHGRSDPKRNLLILAITIFIFYQLAKNSSGGNAVIDIALIIAVLLVHELGHLLAMRLFGYKNVQMFFIPMLGAAVSGTSRNVPTWKKAIVCLMGPLPGIVLGLILGAGFVFTNNLFLRRMTIMFIGINIFNLLPFYPLDGGRFLREILFSRNRYAELIFRIIASGTLILMSLASGIWILAVFVGMSLLTVMPNFRMAGIAKSIRLRFQFSHLVTPDLPPQSCHSREGGNPDDSTTYPAPSQAPCSPESAPASDPSKYEIRNTNDEQIPDDILRAILHEVQLQISPKATPSLLAFYADEIWDRMNIPPASILPTTLLLITYFASFFVTLSAVVAGSLVHEIRYNRPELESKIIESRTPDGRPVQKEYIYSFGSLISETQLSEDGRLYHGPLIHYYNSDTDSIFLRGNWSNGLPDGPWQRFDPDGNLTAVTTWDNGRFVSYEELRDGQMTRIPLDELPPDTRESIEFQQNSPPRGPDTESPSNDPNTSP